MRCSSCGAFLSKNKIICPECESPINRDYKKEVVKKSRILIHLIRSQHGGPSRKSKRKTL